MSDLIGKQLGSYLILERLDAGGYATVYRGKDIHLLRKVAIKVLHQVSLSRENEEQFLKEAQIIANLVHKNIIRVDYYGIQESSGIPYLVMDYKPQTLRKRFPAGRLNSPSTILPFLKQIADALQYAHDHKVIHRDIKPENMLLDEQDVVLLSDFGIAVVYETSHLSKTQDKLGTPYYMAPEQFDGKAYPASDQYALGIVVYEWLCGTRPFNGSGAWLEHQHKQVTPPAMHEKVPSLSPRIEEVVQKALAKKPEERFACVWDFALAFEKACLEGQEENDPQRTVPSPTLPSQSHSPTPSVRPNVATPPEGSSVIWNVPYRQNPFFTGYDDVLTSLYDTFNAKKSTIKTQAISGLGGIGKTQIAIEYAYRYHSEYTHIFWVQGETREKMQADIASLAALPGLKERHEQEQRIIIEVVRNWLRKHTKWLLITDNIEDLKLVQTLLPSEGRGHILLTTRTQTTGNIAQCIDLRKMTLDESTLFLLKRTKRVAPDATLQDASNADLKNAEAIAERLDGLPLALDQAGAYIEETACSLSNYLCHFEKQHKKLLDKRGSFDCDHSPSVTATFSSSFAKVEKISPAAIELLRFCAFLSPDEIPEDLITNGAAELGPRLQSLATDSILLDEVLGLLRRFSLVRRNADNNTLSVHRLVQLVLQDNMSEKTQRTWVERTVRVVNRAFPNVNDFSCWHLVQSYIPQVQRCVALIEQWKVKSLEASRLLEQAGLYLQIQAQFTESFALFEQAANIRTFPADTELATIATLTHHFWHYYCQGLYTEAEKSIQKALKLLPDANQQARASCLCANAHLCYQQGKYSDAEDYFLRALIIYEQRVGLQHSSTACIYCGLANIYLARARFVLAEKYFAQALAIWEQIPEPQHPLMAATLTGIARLSLAQAKYAQAEKDFQKARTHLEQTLPSPHPALASNLNDQALLFIAQGKYKDIQVVEPLLKRSLKMVEQTVGLEHPIAGSIYDTLGKLFFLHNDYTKSRESLQEADQYLQKAQSIREQALGIEHPDVLATNNKQADVLRKTPGKQNIAESLYSDILAQRRHILGEKHPDVAQTLQGMAQIFYDKQGHDMYIQAEKLYQQALAICIDALGKDHPAVACNLFGLATINFWKWKKFDEAETLLQQALDIYEKAGIPNHPDAASIRNTQTILKRAKDRREKGETS